MLPFLIAISHTLPGVDKKTAEKNRKKCIDPGDGPTSPLPAGRPHIILIYLSTTHSIYLTTRPLDLSYIKHPVSFFVRQELSRSVPDL